MVLAGMLVILALDEIPLASTAQRTLRLLRACSRGGPDIRPSRNPVVPWQPPIRRMGAYAVGLLGETTRPGREPRRDDRRTR